MPDKEKKEPLDSKYPRLSFRMGSFLEKPLSERAEKDGSLDLIAKRDLERYYYGLRMTMAKLDPPLTLQEARLLVDVFNGTIFEAHSMGLMWAEVSDALSQGFAQKWEIENPEAFVQRLHTMQFFELVAIADTIERFWNSKNYHIDNTDERIFAVGLAARDR